MDEPTCKLSEFGECDNPIIREQRGGLPKKFCCRAHQQRYWSLKGRNPSKPKETQPEPSPDEQVKAKELKAYESKLRDNVGRTKILCDLLLEATDRINAADLKPFKITPIKHKRDKETMVVLRSDLHPGIITPTYNLDVFHRRMELFTEKIVLIRDIISQTIPLEKLVIINLGDLISGQGIFPNQAWQSEVNVMEQIYHEAAPEIIRQNLTMLEYFPIVEDHYVPGNHGRTGKDFPDQVNFDNVLAQDISRRFEFVDRLQTHVEWDWWKYVDIYNWRFLSLHGNQIRSWLGIPFYGIVSKGMKWQGSMPRGPWHYMVHGHFHVAFELPWNNWHIVSNGALPSDDDFALREIGMTSTPAQRVFGVHPEHGMTWGYKLNLA